MTKILIKGRKEIVAEYWIGSKEKGGLRFLPSSYGVNIDVFRIGEDCPVQKLSIGPEDMGEFIDILKTIKKQIEEGDF